MILLCKDVGRFSSNFTFFSFVILGGGHFRVTSNIKNGIPFYFFVVSLTKKQI